MMNELDKFRQEILESETFCFYPFLELSTNPAGHIKPCCYYGNVLFKDVASKNYKDILSIAKDSKFEDVWNSGAMKEIRKNLTEGKKINECNTCYRDGPASMRVRSIHENINRPTILKLVEDTVHNDYHANYLPKRLELKPSNFCNLKCVMCNSYDSSQVAKEITELSEKYKSITVHVGRFIKIDMAGAGGVNESNQAFDGIETADWSQSDEVWQSFMNIAPHLETLSFAGGEPTLIPFVERALSYCVDNDYAKNIHVYISSNFTNLNKKFLKLMPSFKKFELIASIDGVGLVNDYCRFPSKWSQISSNYAKVKEFLHHKNVKLLVNVTVNLLNVMNLDELLYWIDEHAHNNIHYTEWPYNINLIWSPEDQRIDNLPVAYKQHAIEKLENYKKNSTSIAKFSGFSVKVDLVINELKKPHTQKEDDNFQRFKTRIAVLDQHRNIDIKTYIPELKDLFNV
jgi:MoaA/NifB/PqqE/SkfB family radical SAM enzyme